jgi:transcriptional regulator with XRE-family HTH domain
MQSAPYAFMAKRIRKGQLRGILGRNMRLLRTARGLSQEALAFECGLHRAYVSSVERAERNITLDNIEKIGKGLQVDPWKLLKDDLISI